MRFSPSQQLRRSSAMARPLGLTSTRSDRFDASMFAARNDRYLTPLGFIRSLGRFDLDPCGAPEHPTADTVWTPEEVGDGLSMPWHGRVWLNPPYGRTMREWVSALFRHGSGVALIPCAPDTKLWQELILPNASGVLLVKGRIRYVNSDAPCNHASAVVAVSPEDRLSLIESQQGYVF